MNATVDRLRESLRQMRAQLDEDAKQLAETFRYRYENGKVVFEDEARKRGRELRVKWSVFLRRARPWELVATPLIYCLIVPFVFLDLCVTIFQAVCFPIYRIPKVKRQTYIAVDRHKLTYLNFIQKLNCVYCGYCNGLLAYVREIAARTEYYWCPVKHARAVRDTHDHYRDFLDYGDAESWDAEALNMKDRARACEDCDGCK